MHQLIRCNPRCNPKLFPGLPRDIVPTKPTLFSLNLRFNYPLYPSRRPGKDLPREAEESYSPIVRALIVDNFCLGVEQVPCHCYLSGRPDSEIEKIYKIFLSTAPYPQCKQCEWMEHCYSPQNLPHYPGQRQSPSLYPSVQDTCTTKSITDLQASVIVVPRASSDILAFERSNQTAIQFKFWHVWFL